MGLALRRREHDRQERGQGCPGDLQRPALRREQSGQRLCQHDHLRATGRIQHWVGNDIYVDKKSAAYSTGEVAGTAVEIGLGVGNPCTAAGWASTGRKALNAAEFVGNSLNLGEHLGNGEYLAAAGDALGMMNNVSQMRRSCFAATGRRSLRRMGTRTSRKFASAT